MDIEQNTWEALKQLHPSLPAHTELQPRSYQNESWFVLHDKLNNKFHRINHSAYQLIGLMNGKRSIAEIYEHLTSKDKKNTTIKKQEVITLLQYLHASDLLICEAPPTTADILNRKSSKQKQKIQQWIKNPFIWRIPLFNPNNILETLAPYFKWITSPVAAFIWIVVIGYAINLTITHWSELTQNSFSDIFSASNLLLIWITYPLLKVFHEFGHAIFTKSWNGNVHECGLVFILGTPLPYVDATAATGFNEKNRRLMVSAAGMAVELLIASLALIVWTNADSPLLKSILFNIVLIGGVSTLLFNGNPLMRFDGYYLLTDLLDTPNLSQRAQKQITSVVKRYLLRIDEKPPFNINKIQATWLNLYGILAFVYRFFILFTLLLISSAIHPWLGISLSVWLLTAQLIIPVIKFIHYLIKGAALEGKRYKPIIATLSTAAVACLFLFVIPAPYHTKSQGVIWLPDDARVRSKTEGLIIKSFVEDGASVKKNQPLIQLYNPSLEALLLSKKSTLQEFEIRYQNAWQQNRNQVKHIEEDIQSIQAEIKHYQLQNKNLVIVAPQNGIYKQVKPYNLVGSYIKQGDTFGIITTHTKPKIRVALTQEEIALVRHNTQAIQVRLASMATTLWTGRITQEVPNGTFTLPSPALGTSGGGDIVVTRNEASQVQTKEEVFLLDIELTEPLERNVFGERTYVRFIYDSKPIAYQVARAGKLLFTKILNSKIKSPGQD